MKWEEMGSRAQVEEGLALGAQPGCHSNRKHADGLRSVVVGVCRF